jgi:diguanylate cyclase (GGDEF)-like protein
VSGPGTPSEVEAPRDAMRLMSRSTAVWAGLAFAVLSLVYLGSNGLPLGFVGRFLVAQLAFLIPLTFVVILGAFVTRVSLGAERRFWGMLTAANVVLLASEIYFSYWVAFVDSSGPPQVSAPFQAMHVLACAFILGMLLTMTKFQNATVTTRAKYALDVVGGSTLAYVAILVFGVRPLLADVPNLLPSELAWGAGYPVIGLAVLAGTMSTLLGFKVARWRPWERLVAASIGIYAVGITMWPLLLLSRPQSRQTVEGSPLDLIFVLGHFMLLVAIIYRLNRREQHWPLRPMPLFQPSVNRGGDAVLPVIYVAAMGLFAYFLVTGPRGGFMYWVYVLATTILGVIIIGRSALVAIESGRLFHASVSDPLTGLFNHRFLHDRLAIEIDIARRYGECLSVLLLDLDDFELVNDLYGHPEGDELLRRVGTALNESCRDSDIVCRVGGDEFALIMPETSTIEAFKACVRLEHALRVVRPREGHPVSASIGLASFPEHAGNASDLLAKADSAQQWVKRHGKGQTLVYDEELVGLAGEGERIRTLGEQSHLGAVRALAAAVDARDSVTMGHSRTVAAYAARVGREIGLGPEKVRLLESAALVHDVGMIGIPDDVLRKPGPLSPEERALVMEHPWLGERVVSSTSLTQVLPWIRHHHERWDGTGYPDGLRAVAIPLEARILSVADAYDAMVSERPYREAISPSDAANELIACKGTQFDPSVVDVFVRLLGQERAEG